jgi:hypothetical protein
MTIVAGITLASLLATAPQASAEVESASATSCARARPQGPVSTQGPDSPPNLSGPTRVGAAFHVLELREIDPVQGSYLFRGYVRTSWCDRRLAFDREAEGTDERIYSGEEAGAMLGKSVWFPLGFPVNQVGELSFSERILRIRYDGTVEQDLNIFVPLSGRFDLRRFPFDRQTLQLQLESFVFPSAQVEFVDDPARTGFDSALRLPEWEIVSATGSVSEVDVMRSRERFSRYTLDIVIARKPGFYLWKVFLPMIVIVALSWSIFWMPEERFAHRSRITATGVLTIVAYQFAFAADLPRVGYLTLLDKAMILSFGLLAVTMLESLMISPWQESHPERALRTDRLSRIVFPAVYATGLLSILKIGS